MSKIIFFTLPHLGHITPSIELVKLLISIGDEVEVFTTKEFKYLYENIGCKVVIYKLEIKNLFSENHNLDNWHIGVESELDIWFNSIEAVIQFSNELVREHFSYIKSSLPDIIMYDSYALWGNLLAQRLNIPSICLESFLVINNEIFYLILDKFIEYYSNESDKEMKREELFKNIIVNVNRNNKRLGKKYCIRDFNVFDINYSKYLNLVLVNKEFQPYYNKLDASYNVIGDLSDYSIDNLNEELGFKDKKDGERIYVSRGRISDQESTDFFYRAIEYLQDSYKLVLSVSGNDLNIDQLKINANVGIYKSVNQIEELKKADYFITHGGITGVKEALMLNTPIICYPSTFMQKIIADRIKYLGIGIQLNKKPLDRLELLESIKEIKENNYLKENIGELRRRIHLKYTKENLIEILEEFKNRHLRRS